MPFTFAHPAAVLPLLHPLGRRASASALILGSMAPDFAYFLPIALERDFSHSLAGLFAYCLPAGLMAYALYHILLKAPLLAILPQAIAGKAASVLAEDQPPPRTSVLIVLLSVLAGAFSHIAWDACTHVDGAVVLAVPALQAYVGSVGGLDLHVFRLFQYASSIGGMAFVLWWMGRALLRAPDSGYVSPVPLTWRLRLQAVALVFGMPALIGAAMGASAVEDYNLHGLRTFAGEAVSMAFPLATGLLLAYCAWWHLLHHTRTRSA